jgi:hypothetical protein
MNEGWKNIKLFLVPTQFPLFLLTYSSRHLHVVDSILVLSRIRSTHLIIELLR